MTLATAVAGSGRLCAAARFSGGYGYGWNAEALPKGAPLVFEPGLQGPRRGVQRVERCLDRPERGRDGREAPQLEEPRTELLPELTVRKLAGIRQIVQDGIRGVPARSLGPSQARLSVLARRLSIERIELVGEVSSLERPLPRLIFGARRVFPSRVVQLLTAPRPTIQ